MTRDFFENARLIAGAATFLILIFVGPFALLLGIVYAIDSASCRSKAAQMGLQHEYGPLIDCMVRTPSGEWFPLNSYIANRVQP